MTRVAQQMISLPRRLPAQKFVSLACILVCSLHICATQTEMNGIHYTCTRPTDRIASEVNKNRLKRQATASDADCPANYVLRGDKCYNLSKALNVSFTNANDNCRNTGVGAMLPEPRTPEENAVIKRIMNDNNVTSVWLGATSNGTKDKDNCSIFTWMSPPEEITYSQWKTGQPIFNPTDPRDWLIYDTSGNSSGWKSWHHYSKHPNNIYSICQIPPTRNVLSTTSPQATTLGQTTEVPTKEATFQPSQPSQPTSVGTQPSTTEFRTKASQPTDITTDVTKTTTSAEDRRKKQMKTVIIMASAFGVEWLLYLSCFVVCCWWWLTKGRKMEKEGQEEMERQLEMERKLKRDRRNQKMTCDMSSNEIKEDTPDSHDIIGDASL